MRITKETLLKLAKDTVEKRYKNDTNVVAVFLVGSLLGDDPLLGGTTDIDLLVITKEDAPREHEVVKLSNEIHLDIHYERSSLYAKPRELRSDPIKGWAMWDPTLLHEKGKFFEFTQSVLRSQFEEPAYVLARSRALSAPARETWTGMQLGNEPALRPYLDAVEQAINALAVLSGPPLTERRLLASLPARASRVGRPEVVDTAIGMLGGLTLGTEELPAFLPAWEAAFTQAATLPLDLRTHATRLAYYKQGMEATLQSPFPKAILWPMLHTWLLAAESGNWKPEHEDAWTSVRKTLGLDESGMETRLQSLDHFLDVLEETQDQIAAQNSL